MKQKYNRIIPVIAAIAIQLCLGTAYIWSVFQNGIASSIFGVQMQSSPYIFTSTGFIRHRRYHWRDIAKQNRSKNNSYNWRINIIHRFFIASFTTSSAPWLLWLTYGVLGGIGMGFTYSTTIACAQKWFPDKRGLVTGVIVSALGFGGVVFTPIVETIISKLGKDVPGQGELISFRILSLIFLIVCTVGGLMVKNPPEGFKPEGWTPKATAANARALRTLEVLKTPQLYLLTFSLMLACMGGLMMIGFAKPIAIARGLAETATIGVFAITMFNAFGRLFWGGVSDKLGCKKTIILLLGLTAVLSLCVNIAGDYMIYVLIACIGFAYGGFLSTFPAYTAERAFWYKIQCNKLWYSFDRFWNRCGGIISHCRYLQRHR